MMPDTAHHLAEANKHVAEAAARIDQQRRLIEQLRADGHDTESAERLLASFVGVLSAMEGHRDLMLSKTD
jgi:hypothetical protein